MAKTIMILGASRYYARSIRKARAIGYRVVAVDREPAAEGFADADANEVVDITDRDGVLHAARRHAIDGIVPLNDFGVETAAAVAAELGLTGITTNAAGRATRKTSMRAAWDAAALPQPRWRAASSMADALAAADAIGSWPLIVKPADSHGGASRGVSVASSRDELRAAVEFAQQAYREDAEIIIEEWLDALEHSVETVTWRGETHILAVSDKVKTPLPYRVDKSVDYPTRLEGRALDALRELVVAAVRALGITVGAAHVEACSTATGPKLFELGARCGGGGTPDPIVPYVTGIDMLAEVVRIHAGDPPSRLVADTQRGCVYRFLTPQPGELRNVDGLEEVASWPGVLDCAVLVTPGQAIRSVRVGADRAGFVIAGGQTRIDAQQLADRAEQSIRFIRV
ncbi:MAG TPA: ATP-grasp domain-containing protein [Vicinamibacterales bacterium]|nr:ATP-grasp domain-containing protein [Vicinamibacterales bacterium]